MKNPIIPMLAITGKPDVVRMHEVFQQYKDVGIEQVLLYPRSGCEFEYPSDEWYRFSIMFVEMAISYGMKVWIYDDFNWPSAQVGGALIRQHPEFASKYLRFDDQYRFEICSDSRFADVLNDDCTTEFIRQTHQKYYDLLGKYFGSEILGFFTDEPSFSYCAAPQEGYKVLPYYDGLREEYHQSCGRELYDDIRSGQEYLVDYYRLLGERYRKNYIDKIDSFCIAHKVVSTGHMLDESILYESVLQNGSVLRMLDGMSMPAVDEIYTYTTPEKIEWETFAAERYATRAGKHGMIELFALGPADMPLAKVKQMLCLSALFGIDHYVIAVMAVDARGNTLKRDYFNPNNYMQPSFHAWRSIGAFAKKAAALASRNFSPDVEVIYPHTLCSALLLDSKQRQELENRYRSCLQSLVERQIDWAVIDEDDTPSASVVIRPDDLGDVEQILSALQLKKPYLTDRRGKLLSSVLVKRYTDGGFTALNLNDDDCDTPVLIHTESCTVPATLYSRGMITERDLCTHKYTSVVSYSPEYELSLLSPNSLRPSSLNGTFTFSCAQAMTVRLTLRAFQGTAHAVLDGVSFTAALPCDTLTDGFRQLYKCTEPIHLSAGTHTIFCDMHDYRYLPSALIHGMFGINGNTLLPLPYTVRSSQLDDLLHQFSGVFSLRCRLTLPPSNEPLFLTGDFNGMYVTANINGKPAGEIISHPYLLPIDHTLYGKEIDVCFSVHTPISKMLADISMYEYVDPLGWAKQYESLVTPGRNSVLCAKNISVVR